MNIGIPSEIKSHEYRVAATPNAVRTLCQAGHSVAVQAGAGEGSSFPDEAYERSGATIVATAAEAWGQVTRTNPAGCKDA